jgi:hypothetical protein
MIKAPQTGNVVLLLISTIISFLFVEFVFAPALLSIIGHPSRSFTLLGVVAKPNNLIDDTKINSQGFTGDVLDRQKPPHTTRILTLGGSAMFNRRMTERLIASLKNISSKPLEVQGGALRTHTSRDSILKYKYHFNMYHFDYVLIYEGVNDLWMNHISADKFRPDDVAPKFYPVAIGVWRSALPCWAVMTAVRGAEPSVERSAADRRSAA